MNINENQLSVEGIRPYLLNDSQSHKIHIYESLESTNKTAKEMAASAEHGTVIIADSQTAGRGRYGRSFHSPPGSGLYMSILLHTKYVRLPDITFLTAATAVVVCRAIQAICRKDPLIKWVNDIMLHDKKVCGILAEAVTNGGQIEQIVVGVGVNVGSSHFPAELMHKAGSIFYGEPPGNARNRLAAEIINGLLPADGLSNTHVMHAEYKSRQALLGRKITIWQPDRAYDATALDIDESFRLVVEEDDGRRTSLSFGEASVKPEGYSHAES